MRGDLPVRCTCGAVRGRAVDMHPGAVNHMVCHCRGCRGFAAHMQREVQMLDTHGGVEIFQLSPAALVIEQGIEHIGCIRMTPKGALRWHTRCCRTPIASGLDTRSVPFLSLHPVCIDREALPAPLDDYLGPIRVRANGRFPRDQIKALRAGIGALLPMLFRYAGMCLKWVIRGEHRRSPFFDRETAKPIVEPTVVGLPDDFR